MQSAHLQAAEALESVSRAVAEWTVDQHCAADASLENRFGPDCRRLWRGDVQARVAHLVEALAADEPALFLASAAWSRAAFLARDMGDGDVLRSLRCLREVITEHLPSTVSDRAAAMIDRAIREVEAGPHTPESPLEHMGDQGTLARLYLLHLLQRDRDEAERIVQQQLEGNMPLAEVYERILAPAMNEIGHMWHMHEATIADEHYCTGATQMIMARLRAAVPTRPSRGLRVVATAVGGDLHEVGIRMVADLFDADGWDVEFLGANMPTADLVDAIDPDRGGHATDLVAASASTTLAVRAMADLVLAIRSHAATAHVPIIVGGTPFRIVPDLWQVVGADGFALTAADALKVGEQLTTQRVRR